MRNVNLVEAMRQSSMSLVRRSNAVYEDPQWKEKYGDRISIFPIKKVMQAFVDLTMMTKVSQRFRPMIQMVMMNSMLWLLESIYQHVAAWKVMTMTEAEK